MRTRDQELRAGGHINPIDKTLIKPLNATVKKTKFNTKLVTSKVIKTNGEITLDSFQDFPYVSMRFYGRMFNYLSIYRVTKNVLTLSIKY